MPIPRKDDFKFTQKETSLKQDLVILLALVVGFAAISFGVGYLSAIPEASAFNRITTGPKVTVLDAMFLELRVDAAGNCRQP